MNTFNMAYATVFTLTMVADIVWATIGGSHSQIHYVLSALGAGIIVLSCFFK